MIELLEVLNMFKLTPPEIARTVTVLSRLEEGLEFLGPVSAVFNWQSGSPAEMPHDRQLARDQTYVLLLEQAAAQGAGYVANLQYRFNCSSVTGTVSITAEMYKPLPIPTP